MSPDESTPSDSSGSPDDGSRPAASCEQPLDIAQLLETCVVSGEDPWTEKNYDDCDITNLPRTIFISHPWITRHAVSSLVYFDHYTATTNAIQTQSKESFGDPRNPVLFRIGAAGLGVTGILRELALQYIHNNGDEFRIDWVRDTPRGSQVALLADLVQLSFCTELHNERLASQEGWCRNMGTPLHDHLVMLGPASEAPYFPLGCSVSRAETIIHRRLGPRSQEGVGRHLFLSAGDGSDSFFRKQKIWQAAGIDMTNASWDKNFASCPDSALEKAAATGMYRFTDRSLYLHHRRHGNAQDAFVIVEEDEVDLVTPNIAMVHDIAVVRDSSSSQAARRFAEWLLAEEAQTIIRDYGRAWPDGTPLYTAADRTLFDLTEQLDRLR